MFVKRNFHEKLKKRNFLFKAGAEPRSGSGTVRSGAFRKFPQLRPDSLNSAGPGARLCTMPEHGSGKQRIFPGKLHSRQKIPRVPVPGIHLFRLLRLFYHGVRRLSFSL